MADNANERRRELEKRLRTVTESFEHDMRARGFDPAQAENAALPTPLAALYLERQSLLEELDNLSMTEVERIVKQFQRGFEGQAWHGPALLELLNGVEASDAAAHPIPSAHSIWEIVLHIAAWKGAGVRRLEGDRAELSDAEDWPTVTETTNEAWQNAKEGLTTIHQQLLEAIGRLDDPRLNEPIVEGLSTVYSTLHGILQHDLYHAGQIAILKKALRPA